jgi:hypothetical protein
LRDVVITEFAIPGGGALFVGRGDARPGGMSQREFDHALERHGFSQQRTGEEHDGQNPLCGARTTARGCHCVPFRVIWK